jgi:hypothetical protein
MTVKMLAVVAIPVVALIVITSLSLHSAIRQRNLALETVNTFSLFAVVDVVCTAIRVERGMSSTAMILAMNDTSANSKLVVARGETDHVLEDQLTFWPKNLIMEETNASTKASFVQFLMTYREQVDAMEVDSKEVDYNDILDYYEHVTCSLMDWMEVRSTLVLLLHCHNVRFDSEASQKSS